MATHPRVLKAFNATRALGIPDEEVKSVLMDLLKVYDKNWELIEEDNYRALLDAYFERMENKGIKDEKNGALESDTTNESTSRSPKINFSDKKKYLSSFVPATTDGKLDLKRASSVYVKNSKVEPSHGSIKKEKVHNNNQVEELKTAKIASINELSTAPLSLARKGKEEENNSRSKGGRGIVGVRPLQVGSCNASIRESAL